ncbi:O-antigen ligase family protein [Algoriphagus litoralis]|uniref:O-antigen ligase family protein n=1 Tax=Algoriphagus litoralis TaxID=2202829 RepID=UPI000DBA81E6|nr:O-antigen ligase family protein [Algoriphagus litoralis]
MTFSYLSVDCVNGVLMRMGVGISISQLFKMGMLAGMLLFLLWKNLNYFLIAMGMILFFLLPLLVKSMLTGDTSTVVGNFGYNLKLLFFPISFLFFSSVGILDSKKDTIISAFAWINFSLIAINIFLGVLGIGYSQYDGPEGQGIGGRGFFFAGNEVAGIFVLFAGVCWHLSKSWNGLLRLVFFLFLVILGVLNTSKTAILGILIVTFFLELPKFFNKRLSFGRFLGLIFLPVFGFLITVGVYWGIQATGLIDRIAFFYQRMDLLTFILSGRNEMVSSALSFYGVAYGFWEYLIGVGNLEFLELMRQYHGEAHTIEIDFFDLLFMNGWMGMGLIMSFYLFVFLRGFVEPSHLKTTPMIPINFTLLLISLMAGHIFNSAMLGISLGFFNGLKAYKVQ